MSAVRSEYPKLEIWIEPGRYLVAAAGVLLVGAVVGVEPVLPEELPVVVVLPQAARSITTRRPLAHKNKRR